MMAFIFVGLRKSNSGRILVGSAYDTYSSPRTLIANSVIIQIGDAVTINSIGNIALHTAGDPVFGIVAAVGKNGIQVDPDSGTTDVWTVEGDNLTDKQLYAIVDVSQDSIYSAAVTGTIGTTAASGRSMAYIDATDENDLSETSATRTRGTGGSFVTLGTDPQSATRLLCAINESQFVSAT